MPPIALYLDKLVMILSIIERGMGIMCWMAGWVRIYYMAVPGQIFLFCPK